MGVGRGRSSEGVALPGDLEGSLQDDAILRTEGTGDVRNHSNHSLSMSNTRRQPHTSGSGPISLSESPCCPH